MELDVEIISSFFGFNFFGLRLIFTCLCLFNLALLRQGYPAQLADQPIFFGDLSSRLFVLGLLYLLLFERFRCPPIIVKWLFHSGVG